MPFRGSYNRFIYPEAYTEEEKAILYDLSKDLDPINKRFVEEQVVSKRTKGKLCTAGQKYAHIEPDGMVYRCSQFSRATSIGNFFDENFKLLDNPLFCPMDKCPCEFRWLIENDKEII